MSNIPNESFLATFGKALHYFFKDFYAIVMGSVVSFIGYLLPIRDIVHLLIFFFFADVFFGYWAAKKLRKEKFSVGIIWDHTMPRMFISIVLVTGAFLWDKVYQQDVVSTYKIIGWFVSGILLYSIAKNGYKITKWSAFTQIGEVINDNIKAKTGHNIDDEKTLK